jgi:flagellar biosynthesis protein FlgN
MAATKFAFAVAPGGAAMLADLEAEKLVLTRFLGLLKTEQRALKEGFVDALEQLSQEKSKLVGELNKLEAARDQAAARATADGSAIESWIAREGGVPATQCWLELIDSAREARRINQINGVLIDTLMRNNRRALNMLQTAAQRASLYGPDGHNQNYTGGRWLGAA